MWAEALSGFANSEGGVLIWGVDARKSTVPGGSGRDAVCGLKHIPNPAALRTRLRELQRSMTDPPVGGVKVVDVLDPAKPGEGFVVCYIPESKFKPQQMDTKRRKDIVLRVGDSFVVARPSLLRTLFYPQRSTPFTVEARIRLKAPKFAEPGLQVMLDM